MGTTAKDEYSKKVLARFDILVKRWNSVDGENMTDLDFRILRAIAGEARWLFTNYGSAFPEGYRYEVKEYDISIKFPT